MNIHYIDGNLVINIHTLLRSLKIGDTVFRNLAGCVHQLQVSELTPDKMICGAWEFCRSTGAEIDDDLGWGAPPLFTGSYIVPSP